MTAAAKQIAEQERRVEVRHWTACLEQLKAERAQLKLRVAKLDAQIKGVKTQIKELYE